MSSLVIMTTNNSATQLVDNRDTPLCEHHNPTDSMTDKDFDYEHWIEIEKKKHQTELWCNREIHYNVFRMLYPTLFGTMTDKTVLLHKFCERVATALQASPEYNIETPSEATFARMFVLMFLANKPGLTDPKFSIPETWGIVNYLRTVAEEDPENIL